MNNAAKVFFSEHCNSTMLFTQASAAYVSILRWSALFGLVRSAKVFYACQLS
jgi:hypothetical protein